MKTSAFVRCWATRTRTKKNRYQESVVLPLHHSPKSIVLSASFDFDGAKVQLFYNIPIFWSFFLQKNTKEKEN